MLTFKVGRSLLQNHFLNNTLKLIYNHRNNTHNIYNIFRTYQNNPIEEVHLIYWIYVHKNRIWKQVTCFILK